MSDVFKFNKFKIFNKPTVEDLDKSELSFYFRKDELDMFYNHADFQNKYKKYTPTITAFIHELRKNKGVTANETISYIKKYIINLDADTTREIIYLFLDNKEKDLDFLFEHIDKRFEIVDENEQERRIRIDQDFNRLYDGKATFHNMTLKELFDTLDYDQKEYINEILMCDHGFDNFKYLLEARVSINFNSLVKMFVDHEIDASLFDSEVYLNLKDDTEYYRQLMYTLLTNKNTEIAKLVKILVHNNEYSLIKDMINYNLFDDVVNIDINTNDNEIIRSIENIKNLKKVTVYN